MVFGRTSLSPRRQVVTKPSSVSETKQSNGSNTSEFSLASRGHAEYSDADFELNAKKAKRLVHAAEKTLAPAILEADAKGGRYTQEEIQIGSVLGEGGYGRVSRVISVRGSPHKLVLKTVVPHKDATGALFACHHMVTEKFILSQLSHPNIIRLRGSNKGGLRIITETCRLDSCFLLLDYLPETLDDRIETWRHKQEAQRKAGKFSHAFAALAKSRKSGVPHCDTFCEKVQIAIEVASALEYIHSKRIILRDLKPDNVGFNMKGRVKLFDFGMAEPLPENVDLEKTHDLAGRVGTTRYMASEVLREEPYNVKADVFSFSLVVWEIFTLERPHERSTPDASLFGERPKIPKEWPAALKRILQRGWADDLETRPSMIEFRLVLEDLKRQVEEWGD